MSKVDVKRDLSDQLSVDQCNVLRTIIDELPMEPSPFILEFDDKERCVIFQWISLHFSCIIDSKCQIQLIHSSIPEGPVSIMFDNTQTRKTISIINSFLTKGPQSFHQNLYEIILHESIIDLNDIRHKLSPIRSLLKLCQQQIETLKQKSGNLILKVMIVVQLLLDPKSELRNYPSLKTTMNTKSKPLANYLSVSQNNLMKIIWLQRELCEQALSETRDVLKNLLISSASILNIKKYDKVFSVRNYLKSLSNDEINNALEIVISLKISDTFVTIENCLELIEGSINKILMFEIN